MIIMKNYIEIINKNENEKPIKVYKGNFTFVHKYDEKLFIECLEGEKYINTNPAVSISRFRNAYERFAAVTEGNRRIRNERKDNVNRLSVYEEVHDEIKSADAKYIRGGKELKVTAKNLFVDTLFEILNKDKRAFFQAYSKICKKGYGVLFNKDENDSQIKLYDFGNSLYTELCGSSHVTVGERTTALCAAEVLFDVFCLYFNWKYNSYNVENIPYDEYYPIKEKSINGLNSSNTKIRLFVKEDSSGIKYYLFNNIGSMENDALKKRNYEIINTLYEESKTENVFVNNNEIGVLEARMQVIRVPSMPQGLASVCENMTQSEKRDVIFQIMSILKMMHSSNPIIVHRTLCPHDFLICRNNGRLRVYLYNFSTAKNLDLEAEYTVIGTINNEKVYRLKYTAPEIISNQYEDRCLDRADIYSLGKIIESILDDEDKQMLEHIIKVMCDDDYRKRPNIEEVTTYIKSTFNDNQCYAVYTSKSPKRKQQDAFFVEGLDVKQADEYVNTEKCGSNIICAVFDGIGGGRAGNRVSKLCADISLEFWGKTTKSNYKTVLKKYAKELQKSVREFMDDECYDYSGTTMAIAVIEGNKIYASNVGDSKIYLINKAGIEQLSQDHRFSKGIVKQKELYQYIGMDEFDGEVVPYIEEFDKKNDDYVLLSSDGLSDFVSEEQIRNIIMENDDINEKTKTLVETARKNGSQDDITIIVVKGE